MNRPWRDEELWRSYVPRFDNQGNKLCQFHACSNILKGRQQRWCSIRCANEAWASCVYTAQRSRVLRRDNFTCQKCGFNDRAHDYEVDHIVPLIEGGKLCDPENLRTLCKSCHKEETAALAKRRAMARRTRIHPALEFA